MSVLLDSTDEEKKQWADYSLSGPKGVVNLRFAWTDRDNEGTLISVEIEGPEEIEAVAQIVTSVMQSYYLRPDFPQ